MFLACSMICSLCVWFVRLLICVFVENLKGVGVSGVSGSIRCLYASADSTPNSFTLRLNLVRLYSMFSLLSGSIHLWHWRSYRLDKLYYTIVKVEKRETPPCSSATMIWSLTRWTLLVFYRPQTKFLPVLQVTRFKKSKKIETAVDEYIANLFEDHTLLCSKYMQQITRSKVHLTAAFQIADILTAPRLELTYAYEYFFLLAGIRKRSLRICFVHKR